MMHFFSSCFKSILYCRTMLNVSCHLMEDQSSNWLDEFHSLSFSYQYYNAQFVAWLGDSRDLLSSLVLDERLLQQFLHFVTRWFYLHDESLTDDEQRSRRYDREPCEKSHLEPMEKSFVIVTLFIRNRRRFSWYLSFCFSIECTCCFIQKKNGRRTNQCSSQCDSFWNENHWWILNENKNE